MHANGFRRLLALLPPAWCFCWAIGFAILSVYRAAQHTVHTDLRLSSAVIDLFFFMSDITPAILVSFVAANVAGGVALMSGHWRWLGIVAQLLTAGLFLMIGAFFSYLGFVAGKVGILFAALFSAFTAQKFPTENVVAEWFVMRGMTALAIAAFCFAVTYMLRPKSIQATIAPR